MVDSSLVNKQSELAKHETWEAIFEHELQNFIDHGDDGEIWFGKEVQKKTVAYIFDHFKQTEGLKMLDVGTGNGALLFKLAKKGFQGALKGIDYSQQSISLAS